MSGNGNLRGRVREQRERAEQAGGGEAAVEKRDAPKTVYEFIEAMKGEMARALPRHLNPDRMARIALTEVRRTPLLARCTQASFGGALMTCAQLGLEPGVSGEAYLLPFRNTKKQCYEVQLIIGYQGMAKLFWQSPLARSLDAQAVYENDEFEYAYGLEPKLVHKPSLAADRGKAIAYYAVAKMAGGGSAFIVMSPGDIEKIRVRSRAKDDGPWATDYDAMARKTCLRQLFKLLPRSPELSQALAQDEAVRTDLSAEALDMVSEYPDAVAGEVVRDEPDAAPRQEEEERLREEARLAAEEARAAAERDGVPVEDPPEDLFAGDEG
ncbi:MAG TPA: recombination protein RecT [Streptosporangiaceae bacterium]|nr:recombination protein RecT [Streptosporangiaceae bacterium]